MYLMSFSGRSSHLPTLNYLSPIFIFIYYLIYHSLLFILVIVLILSF